MEKNELPDFIVIDDDYINNVICQMIIQNELQATRIDIFTTPQQGLDFINAKYSSPQSNNAVLFLDINMPALNGWDILELLRNSSEWVKRHLRTYMLSSSATPWDIQKAAADPLVSGYIEKPLKPIDLRNIIRKAISGPTMIAI